MYTIRIIENSGTERFRRKDELDYIAGVWAASICVMSYYNYIHPETPLVSIVDTRIESQRILRNVYMENINDSDISVMSAFDKAIWIKSSERFYYSLYKFKTSRFFEGFIDLCEEFNEDLRDYIIGLPFNKREEQFFIPNYNWASYDVFVDVEDLDDVEEEQRDNENVIELYRKDW